MELNFGVLTYAGQKRTRHISLNNLGVKPIVVSGIRAARSDSRLDITFEKV